MALLRPELWTILAEMENLFRTPQYAFTSVTALPWAARRPLAFEWRSGTRRSPTYPGRQVRVARRPTSLARPGRGQVPKWPRAASPGGLSGSAGAVSPSGARSRLTPSRARPNTASGSGLCQQCQSAGRGAGAATEWPGRWARSSSSDCPSRGVIWRCMMPVALRCPGQNGARDSYSPAGPAGRQPAPRAGGQALAGP